VVTSERAGRVEDGQLLIGRVNDGHAYLDQLSGVFQPQLQTDLFGRHHSKKAAHADRIHPDAAQTWHIQKLVRAVDERGGELNGHRFDLSPLHMSGRRSRAGRGIYRHQSLRLNRLHRAGLNERRYRADGGVAAQVGVATSIHIDQPKVRSFCHRLRNQGSDHIAMTAWLAGQL